MFACICGEAITQQLHCKVVVSFIDNFIAKLVILWKDTKVLSTVFLAMLPKAMTNWKIQTMKTRLFEIEKRD